MNFIKNNFSVFYESTIFISKSINKYEYEYLFLQYQLEYLAL